jgi:hypothetical protein
MELLKELPEICRSVMPDLYIYIYIYIYTHLRAGQLDRVDGRWEMASEER